MISLRVIILWCKASVGRFDATKFIVNRITSKKVCNHCTLVCNHCIFSLPLGTNTPILQWIPVRTVCRSSTVQIIINMTKAELEKKKDLARSLFLSGMEQAEIAEKVDVSRVTVSKWCVAGGWKEIRAAKNITRPELVNKLLLAIDSPITQVNESKDPTLMGSLGDKLSKLSAVIEKLDKKTNVIDAIDVFTAFSKWLEFRAKTDPEVTVELIKQINRFQDMFIIESVGKGTLA